MAAVRKEVDFWLGQAKADMKSATDLLKADDYYASVFFSHQTAEKALKALFIKEKKKSIRTHNLVFLARELKAPNDIINDCAELTPDYITARYPDAATGAPFETYTKRTLRDISRMHRRYFYGQEGKWRNRWIRGARKEDN